MRRLSLMLSLSLVTFYTTHVRADLVGYWSADSDGGTGTSLRNDQGNAELDGQLFGAEFSGDGEGHTGMPGDYAVSFPGEDDDYVVTPPTEESFEEITITAWVNGLQLGAWAGLVVSRDVAQPIGLDIHDFDGTVNYIWNNDSSQTWGFISDLFIPEDEWTFVGLTVDADQATLYAGPKGEELELAVNEIPHFEQDNFTEWRWAEDDCCGGGRNFSGLMDDVSIWNDALTLEEMEALQSGAATPLTLRGGAQEGDYNMDGVLDALDIDLQSAEIKKPAAEQDLAKFDHNNDGVINVGEAGPDQSKWGDRLIWIRNLRGTFVGDVNFDNVFDSGDLVLALSGSKYGSGEMATWVQGDWNGDMLFDSGDLVLAFQDGGYVAAASPVPEPSSLLMLTLIPLGMWYARRSR